MPQRILPLQWTSSAGMTNPALPREKVKSQLRRAERLYDIDFIGYLGRGEIGH